MYIAMSEHNLQIKIVLEKKNDAKVQWKFLLFKL